MENGCYNNSVTKFLNFWFDPSCPWCWITSRWIVEVASKKKVKVYWRSFSLYLKNSRDNKDYTPSYQKKHLEALEVLRIVEAVRAKLGEAKVGDLYTDVGESIHYKKKLATENLDQILEKNKIDQKFLKEGKNRKWDRLIWKSMDKALKMAGNNVGVPLIEFGSHPGTAYFGPVMTPAPVGKDALNLYEVLEKVISIPNFYELKRGRDKGPIFP